MSVRKIIGMENGIEDFRLQVAPRSIVVPKNCKNFRLYLEKGMQVIGKFDNDPNIMLKQSYYRFRNTRPVQFRVTSLQHSNYTWALYSINPETLEQRFMDSVTFNVERTLKLYQMQLLDKQRQIQTSFREKTITKSLVLQLWSKVKREMKTFKSTLKCVFSNQEYQIEFQIEIKNALDYEVERLITQNERRPLNRKRSDDFVSSNGSDIKSKKQSSSQVKEKYGQKPNFIQIEFFPFKHKGDEAATKETIQLEPDLYSAHYHEKPIDKQQESSNIDTFNATVKIVNPSGEQIDEIKHQQNENARKKSYSDSSSGSNRQYPMKKFSLLSDIIEMSYEGSSSYGHPDQSSSNGFNRNSFRKDRTIDYVNDNQMPDQAPGLNKFKTLPYESHNRHNLQVKKQFRRALTAQKNSKDFETSSQLQQESYLTINQNKKSSLNQAKTSSGDPYGKWIILAAILIVIAIVSGAMAGQSNNKSNLLKKKSKKRGIN